MAEALTDPLIVGRVIGLYGIKGWVKVFSYTHPRENILHYSPWHVQLDHTWQALALLDGRRQGQGIIVQIEGYTDPSTAMRLLGASVAIRRDQLPDLGQGELYWVDLIGLQVISKQGDRLGAVAEMIETGANDVLVVRGEREHLIPFVKEVYILEVDLSKGYIKVDWEPDF
jgi:16S rRNA processing protein RimM